MNGRTFPAMALALMLLLATASCGGAAGGTSESAAAGSSAVMDAAPEEALSSESAAAGAALGEQKLILTARMELETTAFDETAERLASLTAELGGYFESSSVDNRSGDYRWAEYTVRVPSGQYQTFLDQTGELCNVLWSNATQEDVSEAYYDTEGRLRTQQIKLERLQSLLEQAENMEDIITIESAISETEQQIDDLSGTLQHYDALVDYAAVHLTLYEVYQLSDETQAPGGFGQRLGAAFTGGLRSFGDVLEGLVLAAAYGWVWLVLLAAAAAVAVRQVRRRRRRDAQDQHDNPPKL